MASDNNSDNGAGTYILVSHCNHELMLIGTYPDMASAHKAMYGKLMNAIEECLDPDSDGYRMAEAYESFDRLKAAAEDNEEEFVDNIFDETYGIYADKAYCDADPDYRYDWAVFAVGKGG